MTTPKLPPAVQVDASIRSRYASLIESARRSESKDPAANRHPWQCEIALTQLSEFALTKQQIANDRSQDPIVVRLRTDSMPRRIYDKAVGDNLIDFVSKGGQLHILLTASDSNYDVSSLVRFQGRENVQIKKERTEQAVSQIRNHFLLVDSQAYRYEAEHGSFTGDEFRIEDDFHPVIPARICFNDPDSGKLLKDIFVSLWNEAKPETGPLGRQAKPLAAAGSAK